MLEYACPACHPGLSVEQSNEIEKYCLFCVVLFQSINLLSYIVVMNNNTLINVFMFQPLEAIPTVSIIPPEHRTLAGESAPMSDVPMPAINVGLQRQFSRHSIRGSGGGGRSCRLPSITGSRTRVGPLRESFSINQQAYLNQQRINNYVML